MRLHLLLLLAVFVIAVPTIKADTLDHVYAYADFPGTYEFGTGLGVDETFTATFNWDVNTNTIVPNTLNVTTTGPLGPFTLTSISSGNWIMNFSDPAGTVIQMWDEDYVFVYNGLPPYDVPGTYFPIEDFFFINCGTECPVEISNPFQIAEDPTLIVSQAPEPGTFSLLLIGLTMLLFLIGGVARRERALQARS